MKTTILLWFAGLAMLARSSTQDLVVRVARQALPQDQAVEPKTPGPQIYSMHVESRIAHRYAKTAVISRIANPASKAQEVSFNMVLPETAFIAGFVLEVDGKTYEAYVKEKEEAKKEYDQAVSGGQTAALVGVSARDSNTFSVSVNVEPSHKVTFNLTYEELLTRKLGDYSQVINLNPGQLIRDLTVDVYIKESRNITKLSVPEFRSGNEIESHEGDKQNSLAKIEKPSSTEAHIHFAPSIEEQKVIATKKKDKDADSSNKDEDKGLGGQFIVQYDVDREPQGGEVLVNEGYFVHFFAPSELPPLNKHAIFVLDVSGSMEGRKVEQLKEAMTTILDDLNEGDYFNIIEFSYSVTVWNLDATTDNLVYSPYNNNNEPAKKGSEVEAVPAFPATPDYIKKAKDIVNKMTAGGGTNIHDSLQIAIREAQRGLDNVTFSKSKPEPIIVFLTDGEPTVGETRPEKLFSVVSELNENPSAAIFSLAFGDDADFGFLKKLSLRNNGFGRKIYEAADATLQLRDFYKQVASPLLANVTFKYDPDKVDENSVTRKNFPIFFLGSEIVVAGRLANHQASDLNAEVSGLSLGGPSVYHVGHPYFIPDTRLTLPKRQVSSLEKLWAYLSIQQLLEKDEASELDGSSDATTNKTEAESSKKKALKLALEYSFVTKLTSLVVVKPNDTSAADLETTKPRPGFGYPGINYPAAAGVPFSSFGGSAGMAGGFGAPGIPGGAFLPGRPSPPLAPSRPQGFHYTTARPFYPTTTFRAPTSSLSPAAELVSLNDLTWLADATNSTDNVAVPLANGTELFKLGLNEENLEGEVCSFPDPGLAGSSHCRHLSHCVLNKIVSNINEYPKYFCRMGKFAGICCPDELQPTPMPLIPEPSSTLAPAP